VNAVRNFGLVAQAVDGELDAESAAATLDQIRESCATAT
jgi:hypothetical protein